MPEIDVLKSAEFRAQLPRVLRDAQAGQPALIEQYNRPVAAVISTSDFWLLQYVKARATQENPMQAPIRLAISNISGGEGKTTLARELAFALSGRGYKVALFDLDPQASLTKGLGLHTSADAPAMRPESTVTAVFRTDQPGALPAPIHIRGVDVWPANDSLGEAEGILMGDFTRVENLRLAVDDLLEKNPYDVVIFDCKPQRTNFLAASIAAADHIILPVSGMKGVENTDQIAKLLRTVKPYSPKIALRLIVPNRMKAQTRHHKNLLAFLDENYRQFAPISRPVRDSTAVVGSAAESRESVVQHAPNSDVAGDFQAVADDLLSVLEIGA
ncbi:AAA family ATPase [Deinococcus sp. Leaf326]|uniref:AAA family ATPase n=1 Tax=Deinococcus sp. Leaf326 TaxID=1736338 RepID=UPI0012E1276D|nr:AAA family ATPase [Deinococcus sp. Leaf326]